MHSFNKIHITCIWQRLSKYGCLIPAQYSILNLFLKLISSWNNKRFLAIYNIQSVTRYEFHVFIEKRKIKKTIRKKEREKNTVPKWTYHTRIGYFIFHIANIFVFLLAFLDYSRSWLLLCFYFFQFCLLTFYRPVFENKRIDSFVSEYSERSNNMNTTHLIIFTVIRLNA